MLTNAKDKSISGKLTTANITKTIARQRGIVKRVHANFFTWNASPFVPSFFDFDQEALVGKPSSGTEVPFCPLFRMLASSASSTFVPEPHTTPPSVLGDMPAPRPVCSQPDPDPCSFFCANYPPQRFLSFPFKTITAKLRKILAFSRRCMSFRSQSH